MRDMQIIATLHSRIMVKDKQDIAACKLTSPLREITYRIRSQCYLPPNRGDFSAVTPVEAGTRFSDLKWMQG